MIVMGMRKLVDVIVWCHCRLSELRDVIVDLRTKANEEQQERRMEEQNIQVR